MVLAKVYRNHNEKEKKQKNIKWGSFPEENCHILTENTYSDALNLCS